jgi:branched-chain amino acid transport system permease protein
MPPLLVTFGLSVILQNLLLEMFSADSQRLDAGAIETASISLGGGLAIGWFPLIILCCSVAIIASLEALFAWTSIGRAFRAVSDDQRVSQLMGIDNRRVFAVALPCSRLARSQACSSRSARRSPRRSPEPAVVRVRGRDHRRHGVPWERSQEVQSRHRASFGFRTTRLGHSCRHIAFLAVLVVRPQGFPKTKAL